MVLESTIVCVDNSDYMRNGDFIPTRLQAQQDAVHVVCQSKTRSNPENNVGLLTLAKTEVLVTLTTDVGKLLSKLNQVRPKGNINFVSAIRIAHLVLKHRQGKNHRMRIVVFIGSPVEDDEKELIKLAKRLRKEKVNMDIVNFGEESMNSDKLSKFVSAINGNEGSGSHLVTVATGPRLSDALISSPVIVEDGGVPGAGFEFGIDPNEDPELALALRVSMEEQRARQEDEARQAVAASVTEASGTVQKMEETDEDLLLKQALEMSMQPTASDDEQMSAPSVVTRDFSMMSEDEQVAYAMQMSMDPTSAGSQASATEMDTDDKSKNEDQDDDEEDDDDLSDVMNDPAFLQSVLESLPGVDPQSEEIRNAMGQLTGRKKDDKKSEKKDSSDDKKSDKKDGGDDKKGS